MLGFFRKKTKQEKLMIKYRKLQKEAYTLAKSDRVKSDAKYAEAEIIMNKIEALVEKGHY